MKRVGLLLILSIVTLLVCLPAVAQEDIAKAKNCKFCGMDREKFASSRVWVEYADGSAEGMCSIRCASVELVLSLDKFPKTIWVGDYGTKQLTDAEKAFWVVGGDKSGVMTRRPKWAFAKKEDAEAFVRSSGGTSMTFEQAMKAAYEDLYEDTRTIRDRREAKRKAATEKK